MTHAGRTSPWPRSAQPLNPPSSPEAASPEHQPQLPVRGRGQLCDGGRSRRRSRVASLAKHARDVVGLLGDLDDPQPAAALLAGKHIHREHALERYGHGCRDGSAVFFAALFVDVVGS